MGFKYWNHPLAMSNSEVDRLNGLLDKADHKEHMKEMFPATCGICGVKTTYMFKGFTIESEEIEKWAKEYPGMKKNPFICDSCMGRRVKGTL